MTSTLRNGPLKNSREGLDNYRPVNERVVPRANIVQRPTNTYLNDDILRNTMMAGIIDHEDPNLWDTNQIYICPISELNVYQTQFPSERRMRFENGAEANAFCVKVPAFMHKQNTNASSNSGNTTRSANQWSDGYMNTPSAVGHTWGLGATPSLSLIHI